MRRRTCAVFTSGSFNTSEPRPHFVRPDNYGDDVARWLMDRLARHGARMDAAAPAQEDHGWYVSFDLRGRAYDLLVVHLPDSAEPRWLVCLERGTGWLGWLLGRRTRGIAPEAVDLLSQVLSTSDECRLVAWLSAKEASRGRIPDGTPPEE